MSSSRTDNQAGFERDSYWPAFPSPQGRAAGCLLLFSAARRTGRESQVGMMTTPLAVPFLLTTVTRVPTFKSATVLPSGRSFVSDVTATVCDAPPAAGVSVSVVALLLVDTAVIVPTTWVACADAPTAGSMWTR